MTDSKSSGLRSQSKIGRPSCSDGPQPSTPPPSPPGSSLNSSTTSLSSVSHRKLRLGERVIVSSKTGVLRFMGTTEFAAGEWCGIELDDPVGKNDGSVEEKRYFECQPKHGLFAPMQFVRRSPSNVSASTAASVQRPSGAALSTPLERSDLREFVVSASSVASTGELDISNLSDSPKDSSDPVVKYKEDLRKKEQELDEVRNEVKQLQSSLESVQSQLTTTEQNLKESQQSNKELSLELEGVNGLLVAETESHVNLLTQVNLLKIRQKELIASVEKNKHLKVDLESKTREVSELTAQLSSSLGKIKELRNENVELQKMYDEVIGEWNKNKTTSDEVVKDVEMKLERFMQEFKAMRLVIRNKRNLHEVEVVSNNQSTHAASGDMKNQKNNTENDINTSESLEECELVRNGENDTPIRQVETPEMAIPPSVSDDYNSSPLNDGMVASRMFCYICDQFDLHVTEDCPQVQESPGRETSDCDRCRESGHDAVDCSDFLTF